MPVDLQELSIRESEQTEWRENVAHIDDVVAGDLYAAGAPAVWGEAQGEPRVRGAAVQLELKGMWIERDRMLLLVYAGQNAKLRT